MVVGPSRADSGRPLFVIFFFKNFFFRVGPSRPESKKLGPTQKKVGPSRAESNFFWFFFFGFFFFCFVFFLVFFFFGKDFTVGGPTGPESGRLGPTRADSGRLGPSFFFDSGRLFFKKNFFFDSARVGPTFEKKKKIKKSRPESARLPDFPKTRPDSGRLPSMEFVDISRFYFIFCLLALFPQ